MRVIRRHGRLRAFLLGLFLVASLGTGVELLLLEHTEGWQQLVPLVTLVPGLLAGATAGLRPGPRSLRAFRVVMGGVVLAGAAGLYPHYVGNVDFELEMYPSLGGLELFRRAMQGATPALAPAAMAWLGLLGIAFTCQHPGGGRSPA